MKVLQIIATAATLSQTTAVSVNDGEFLDRGYKLDFSNDAE